MPSVSASCGLSMSETAEFCPTCGTRTTGGSASGAGARPLWAAAEAAPPYEPPYDYYPSAGPVAAPAAKPSAALHNDFTRLVIAAAGAVLVIVLVAVFMHVIFSGTATFERYTAAQYDRITKGLTLTQVEAILGPPTSQSQYQIRTASAVWVNSDGWNSGWVFRTASSPGQIPWGRTGRVTWGSRASGDLGSIALGFFGAWWP